jgi:RNA polymerase sigma factor (sigma-70 family)
MRDLAASDRAGQETDHHLVDDFTARRDEAAFAALVARHGLMVLGVCRRVLSHEQDAEDAFQATFLVLARNAGSIRMRETVGNWLHGVAYRTAMKAKRSAARRRNQEARLQARVPPPAPSPNWEDVQAILDEEIQKLPLGFRQAFILSVLEGKSGSEAAIELGCKEGTVRSRVNRARRVLQQQLTRRGVKLTALLAALSLTESAGWAVLPATLAQATIRSGLLVAAGEPTAGVIPSHVAALAAGVTRAMFLTKAKIATMVLLAAGVFAGAALWAQPLRLATTADPSLAAQPPTGAEEKQTQTPQADREAGNGGAPRTLKLEGGGRRVAWSPDGKMLAVAEISEPLFGVHLFGKKESALKLWDVERGQVKQTLAESATGGLAFQQVVFSADGKRIAATVSEVNADNVVNVVKVWDTKTADLKHTLTSGGDSQLLCVAFAPDGKLVAAGDFSKKTVLLWDAGTGALKRTLQTGEVQPWSLVFSPDSKTLIVGGQKAKGAGVVGLWDVGTGKLKHTLERERYLILQPRTVFSADGKMFIGGGAAGEVVLWDAANGKRIGSLQGLERITRSMVFSPDGTTVAAAGREGKARLWDVQTGKLRETLEADGSEIYSLAFSSDGKTLASASQDGTVRLWRMGKRTVEKK